ncbi:MAG TPA: hypothetical protein VGP72_22555 [Planctomycetota bacterium]|jgi:hypothetical protein
MYGTPSNLFLGFHGCDRAVGEKILAGKSGLKESRNKYDWLGFGRYFWEGDYGRAVEWSNWLAKRKIPPRIEEPFVIGAIIDLGHCLNLLETENLRALQDGYEELVGLCREAGKPIPENKPLRGGSDLLLRHLDCAVLETVHRLVEEAGRPAYDSVRGVFWGGKELYPHAGFRSHNHIQICVRNPNCIKGYFRPLKPSRGYRVPSKINQYAEV